MTDVVVAADPLISLEQAKAHLRVDHDDDDILIQLYMDGAHARALDYCNRCDWPEGDRSRSAFRAAVLLILGDLYAFRETAQVGSVSSEIRMNPAASALIDPYRNLRV